MVMITNSFDKFPNEPTGSMYEQFGKTSNSPATTSTYTGDYSSTSGWTQATTNTANSGTGAQTVGIDGGWAYANSTGSANGQFVYTSLGTTLSDTKWFADFEYYNIGAVNLYPFVLAAGTSSSWDSTQDMISVIEGGTNVLMIRYRDGSSQANSSASSAMSTNTSYFCRLIRDGQVLTLKMYTDSARTSQHGSDMTVTISGSVTGLTTLHHSGITGGGATSGYYFKVRGTKIYNGVTSVESASPRVKQRFVEWFSGKSIPSYWNLSQTNGGVSSAMEDEVDGGHKISFSSQATAWGGLDFNNDPRQFSLYNSTFITTVKRTFNSGVTGGFWAGLSASKNTTQNDTVAFSSNTSSKSNFFLYAKGNTTSSTEGSCPTVDNEWHTGKVVLLPSSMTLSIDGVLGVTVNSGMGSSDKAQPHIHGIKYGTSTGNSFSVRYFEAYNT